jgi:hypothetical protein
MSVVHHDERQVRVPAHHLKAAWDRSQLLQLCRHLSERPSERNPDPRNREDVALVEAPDQRKLQIHAAGAALFTFDVVQPVVGSVIVDGIPHAAAERPR